MNIHFFTNKIYVCTVRITIYDSIIERVLFINIFTWISNTNSINEFLINEFNNLNLDKISLFNFI